MSRTRPAAVLRRLSATAARPPAADPDLLRAFLASKSEPAFAEIVRRHGPMVLAVCRRVLGHAHDAEDAFQAVFLVLARKAATVRGANLAGWLYGVAVRTARGVRLMRDRRQKREAVLASPGREPGESFGGSPEHAELAAILDEELARLPDHYRLPVVLCELQGRSRKEAAAELGVAEGTLSSRLAAARKKLADQLGRRGVAATAGALTAALAGDAAARLPDGLAESTARAAAAVAAGKLTTGLVSPLAAEAAQFGLKVVLADRLRAVVVVLAAVGVGLTGWAAGPGVGGTAAAVASEPRSAQEPKPVVDPAKPSPADPPEKGAMAWPRFSKIIGDDAASRRLFDLIVSDPKNLELILAAQDGPNAASTVYLARRGTLLGKVPNPRSSGTQYVTTAELAGWFYLGTFDGTEGIRSTVTHQFLPEPGRWQASRYEFVAEMKEGPIKEPLRKLVTCWAERRVDDNALGQALEFAKEYDVKELVPAARKRLAAEKDAVYSMNRARAIVVVGKLGDASDLPVLTKYLDDATYCYSVGFAEPGEPRFSGPQPVKDGKSVTTELRDVAATMLVLRHGGDPREFGLLWPCKVKGVPIADPYAVEQIGYISKAEREAAHKKIREWLDKQKKADPPQKGAKFWPHFSKVVGDDVASRALFDLIVSDQQNVQLLEAAEANAPELAKWYFLRRSDLYGRSSKPSDRVPGALQRVPVPVEDVAGWLLLGTYTGTKVDSTDDVSLTFLNGSGDARFIEALSDRSAVSKPLRKLLAAWLANRADDVQAYHDALPLALNFHIPEALPTARRVVKFYLELPPERRHTFSAAHARLVGLLVVGEYGTRADLPVAEACFNDLIIGAYVGRRNPLDSQTNTAQVRDVAVGVAVHLRGGKPQEFGLVERAERNSRRVGRFDPWQIDGFLAADDREAAHKAARKWLDESLGPADGLVRTFPAPAGVSALAFDPRGERLFVGCTDLSAQVWNPATGQQVGAFRVGAEGANGTFSGLAVSPDGTRIAARYFVADPDGKFLFGLEGHVAEVSRMRFDRDGKRVATSSFDGTVRIWDAATGKERRKIEAHMGRKVPGGPRNGFGPRNGLGPGGGPGFGPEPDRYEGRGACDVSFSPDGTRLVSGGADGDIRVWDADTGKAVWGGQVSRAVAAVAYLADGKRVVSGGQEGHLRVWDVDTGKEVQKLVGHTDAVAALAVTPDGKRLVSAGYDQTVRVWDVETGRVLACYRTHGKWLHALAVAPDGRTAAAGGLDGVVWLWAVP